MMTPVAPGELRPTGTGQKSDSEQLYPSDGRPLGFSNPFGVSIPSQGGYGHQPRVVVDRRVTGMAPPQSTQGDKDHLSREADDRRPHVDAPPRSTRPGYHSQGEDDRSAHRDVPPRSDRTGHQSREIGDRNSQQHASSRSNRPIDSPDRSGSGQGSLGPVHVISGQTSGHGMVPGQTG
jgi:hypothetical protein